MENDKLTEKIIACAFKVHNTLGSGFLEKVYENALRIELKKAGFNVEQQYPIPVYYDDEQVGDYYADLLVNKKIIIELKAVENMIAKHEVQLVNYLAGTGFEIGLLINFGSSVEVKRKYRIYKPNK
ncbi:MAG: GxxExxY protein [Bacteroidales bacterium]|nr:GxxExxY protein [Bacteroidales bacterium]